MAQTEEKEIIFEKLRDYCPKNVVYRNEIDKLTGGLLLARTMTNKDSQGIGIQKRRMVGRRVVYTIDELIEWLKNNTKLINF